MKNGYFVLLLVAASHPLCLASCGPSCAHISKTINVLQDQVMRMEGSMEDVKDMVKYLLSPPPPFAPSPPLPPPTPPHHPLSPPFFPSLRGRDLFHDSVDTLLKTFIVSLLILYVYMCFAMSKTRGNSMH